MRRPLIPLAALFVLAVAGPLRAAEPWGTPHDALLGHEEVTVQEETMEDGTPRRVLTLPGPVIVDERRAPNGRVDSFSMDMTGKGAVGCIWGIYVELLAAAQFCQRPEDRQVAAWMSAGLTRIERFVAENSYGLGYWGHDTKVV